MNLYLYFGTIPSQPHLRAARYPISKACLRLAYIFDKYLPETGAESRRI